MQQILNTRTSCSIFLQRGCRFIVHPLNSYHRLNTMSILVA